MVLFIILGHDFCNKLLAGNNDNAARHISITAAKNKPSLNVKLVAVHRVVDMLMLMMDSMMMAMMMMMMMMMMVVANCDDGRARTALELQSVQILCLTQESGVCSQSDGFVFSYDGHDPIGRLLSRVGLHLWSPSRTSYRNKDLAAMSPFTQRSNWEPERESLTVIWQRWRKTKGSTRWNWRTRIRGRMKRRKKWERSSLRRRRSRRWPGGNASTSSPTSPSNLSCSSTGLSGGFALDQKQLDVDSWFPSGASIEWPRVSWSLTRLAWTTLASPRTSATTFSTTMQTTLLSRWSYHSMPCQGWFS